jgi:Peptidase M50B-like
VDATQLPLSGTETVLIGLAVAAVVVPSATWPLVQHFQVMAHEGMHGVVGSVSGRRVGSIELNSDATGGTGVSAKPGPGDLAVSFAGYLGPAAFGLGAARLIQFGHIIAVLWLAMVLLGLLLWVVLRKRSFGWVTVPLAGFLVFLVLKHAPQTGQILASYVITWFLLLSGVRIVVQRGAGSSDAGDLRDSTSIPQLVWFLLWLAVTLAAVAIGARWMLHPAVHLAARH